MQLIVALLLIPARSNAEQHQAEATIMVNGAGPILCPTPPIPDSNWNRHYHSSSETFCGGAKTCGALAVPALQSIKAIHDPLRSKGHGSTLGMRLDNPFVFFMQAKYADREVDSSPGSRLDWEISVVGRHAALMFRARTV
ncbi:hypothetical protein HPB51_018825 [Rhipicephalus microplus]|uniref:Uncharacterized protein n=1 Tax=Rhipicephalus microplus TaxID=6941 RepID=A0A9J6DBH1_RHIMP|nr:hypothetical protein HPB51_018825 [Rhipicephalus microplus]